MTAVVATRRRTTILATIEVLPEDTLLEVFDFYRLDAIKQSTGRLWKWHRLAHVCRKWRHVLSMSPRRLDLRVLCECGAPIESILSSWPTFPLVVRHNGPKSKFLPNNVIIALHRRHRVFEIDLVLPRSLIGPIIEAIQEPLQGLERIQFAVENDTGPPMPLCEGFLGGSAPQLREIKLDGIAFPFPALRQVLLSTNNLVELHLANIPNDFYIPPDGLVTGLSTLVQLKRLTVGFQSPASLTPQRIKELLPRCTTLPSLTFLDFHGASEYLEEFISRIDSPVLCELHIGFFNDILFEVPQFCQFISRLNALVPPTELRLTHSWEYVTISSKKPKFQVVLETSCRLLDWQLSFVTQISNQLSPLFSAVRSLTIQSFYGIATEVEDVDSTQWLDLFQSFAHVTQVSVFGEQLLPGIVMALVAAEMGAGVLPELTSLFLNGYRSSPSVAKVAEQFIATRGFSGRAVDLAG